MAQEILPFGAVFYADILGYEKRADEEAKKTDRPVEDIRSSYIWSIEERLNQLQESGAFSLYKIMASQDSWLVFTDTVLSAFEVIGEVLKAGLPLAIVVHTGRFERSIQISRTNKVVEFLKTNILEEYKRFYKRTQEQSAVHTFILITLAAYERIDYEGICSRPFPKAKFFLVKQQKFQQELGILGFLKKVNLRRMAYRRIGELYVQPRNYAEIKRILDKHHVVFLIGDAEEGKTYTAVRLLLDYSDAYEPLYISEESKEERWEFIRGKREIEGRIVYLEDPWGKVEFETAQSLYSDIGPFLAEVKAKRSRVIITSREKVFREFIERKETAESLDDYAAQFRVHLTYSAGNLKKMFWRYLSVFHPSWGRKKNCRSYAVRAVGNELRTPMSIKRLMDYSREIENKNELELAIQKAAEDTKIAFAMEIKEMFNRRAYDKLIFLSFAHVGIKPKMAKSLYESLLGKFGCDRTQSLEFDALLEEFAEVETANVLRFIHPAYWDAFNTALVDNGKPNRICKRIFEPVLLQLCLKDETVAASAWAVAENFNNITEDVRNELLLWLSDNDKAINAVASTTLENFDYIREDIRNALLSWLYSNNTTITVGVRIVAENFDYIPEDIRNNLLFLFWKRYEHLKILLTASIALEKLVKHPRVDKVLDAISIMEKGLGPIAQTVMENYDKLPEWRKILAFGLCKEDWAAWVLVQGLEENFDKIPENERNVMLIKLSKNRVTANTVRQIVARYSRNIPRDLRNSLGRLWKNT